jgi:lipopolysaccharide/colanic/teichoic acid biosynthesis glycosyltransferase
MYAKLFKRLLDFILSFVALIVLSPILLILTVIGAIAMGGNPFFIQLRPGKIDPKTGKEKIFRLVKFRTMSNKRDVEGNLFPDDMRLNKYGKFLRSTSLDELLELLNILKGDMAIVGPRPQLVRDMVFMSREQRKRHTVSPGLTGLAQVNGRNGLSWEKKFEFDLRYIEKITLWNDMKIIFKTVCTVFAREGISQEGMVTAEDLGDYLLHKQEISHEEYICKQEEAREILNR